MSEKINPTIADWNLARKTPAGSQSSDGSQSVRFAPTFLPDSDAVAEAEAAERRTMDEINLLGLQRYAEELDEHGFTVLPPEEVASVEFSEALRDCILEVSQGRSGKSPDLKTGASHSNHESPFGAVEWMPTLLVENPIFEQALMNRKVIALITYLLGESCILNHLSSMVKGPGGEYLPLHTDQNQTGCVEPFPPYASVANATWALTDYSEENGALCVVPGSHRWCRPPNAAEATDLSSFKPVEAPAGSVIIWHGNTWHGAVPRRAPGLRVSLVEYFQRWYHPPIEELAPHITEEILQRNSDRFAVLTGVRKPMHDIDTPTAKAAKIGLFA